MKQKMVVKVSMNGQKSRSKALKIAVSLSGVESASLKGDDKSQIEVTGDGVDAVQLTSLLRKSVGHAELVSVAAVGGEKKDDQPKKDDSTKKDDGAKQLVWPYNPPYVMYEVPAGYGSYAYPHEPSPSCSIM